MQMIKNLMNNSRNLDQRSSFKEKENTKELERTISKKKELKHSHSEVLVIKRESTLLNSICRICLGEE